MVDLKLTHDEAALLIACVVKELRGSNRIVGYDEMVENALLDKVLILGQAAVVGKLDANAA